MHKPRVRARDVLGDIVQGLSDAELMEKYRLAPGELRSLARKLLAARDPSEVEVRGNPAECEDLSCVWLKRRTDRFHCPFWIPVYDDTSREVGSLGDISEHGMSIEGFDAKVGEMWHFTILAQDIPQVEPFGVEAVCRWVTEDESYGHSVSGFEILDVRKEGLQELRKLVLVLSQVSQ
jgi:hypothetical protein